MAQHIRGPLYYERMGRSGPLIAFIHPNPMDQSCWIYQMAQFSTWYRCMSIDIPGYGRSPKADAGLTMDDMSQACWEAIDEVGPGERAILVGCSVGSSLAPFMFHQRPKQTAALVVCGTGYNPTKEFTKKRIDNYTAEGIGYRWRYALEDMSAAFRTTPMAHFFANMFTERNGTSDVETIIHQFRALAQGYPEGHHERIACPMIILTGSEDNSHPSSFELQKRVPNCELRVLPGAGHACQLEQPWLFNKFMIEFLTKHGLFPGPAK